MEQQQQEAASAVADLPAPAAEEPRKRGRQKGCAPTRGGEEDYCDPPPARERIDEALEPLRKLACAVLHRAVLDARSATSLKERIRARQFICAVGEEEATLLEFWCHLAKWNPAQFKQLAKREGYDLELGVHVQLEDGVVVPSGAQRYATSSHMPRTHKSSRVNTALITAWRRS
jgi:hypothetical protein